MSDTSYKETKEFNPVIWNLKKKLFGFKRYTLNTFLIFTSEKKYCHYHGRLLLLSKNFNKNWLSCIKKF